MEKAPTPPGVGASIICTSRKRFEQNDHINYN